MGLWDAFTQYLYDAAPGGVLNPEVTRQGLLDTAAAASSPIPIVGDVSGAIADWNMYKTDPSSRTWGNYGLSLAGLFPFVLSASQTKTAKELIEAAQNRPFARTYGIPKKDVTVMNPQRAAYPGIYGNPKEMVAQVAEKSRTVPENPWMKKLWGVTRDDLYQMSRGRVGNQDPIVQFAANARGSEAARNVMNPRNTQRIGDILAEAQRYPELAHGMEAWYEMEPVYKRLTQISDDPIRDYNLFNVFTGMSSPGSEVLDEITRGTGARYLHQQGRFEDFVKHGGTALKERGADFPQDMIGISPHPYHKTSQVKPMRKFIETGDTASMDSPKVPLYIQSNVAPEVGFQTALPVGDAHFSRGVGLADTRNWSTRINKDTGMREVVVPKASISKPELGTIGEWWANDIAAPLGMNSVQAQGLMWGALSPFTGVSTPVGAPKLELITQKILEAAAAHGISPYKARDMILLGKMYAPNLNMLQGRSLRGLLD